MPRTALLRYALLTAALVTFAACGGGADEGATVSEDAASEQTEASASESAAANTFDVPSDFPIPSSAERTDESTAATAYYTVPDMTGDELVSYFETQIPSSGYTATRGQPEPVETATYTRLASWTVEKGEDYNLQVRAYSDGTVGFTVAD